MTKRDEKQKEIVNLIISKAKKNDFLHHSFIASTGLGKSKIVMDLIEPLQEILKFKKILIIVDNTRLRDHNWKEDFIKWGLEGIYNNMVEMNTYQTVYKWTKSLDDYLVICDEMDFAFTPEYGKFFKNYLDINMLGMTGYVTEAKKSFMAKYLPCLIEYTQKQAQDDGILNTTPITFVKYDISRKKDIKVEYKDKKTGMSKVFYESENGSYNYWDKELRKALGELAKLKASALITGNYAEIKRYEQRIQARESAQLTKLMLNLESSAKLTRTIIDKIHKKSNTDKVVIFSKRREQSSQITNFTYHGGNSNIVNDSNFDKFNAGDIRELGLVDKINRGVNMRHLRFAIMESFFGSDTMFTQKSGRMMRLDPTDFATIYILMPYFMRKTKAGYNQAPTLAVKWAYKMLLNKNTSKARIVDLRTIKSDL